MQFYSPKQHLAEVSPTGNRSNGRAAALTGAWRRVRRRSAAPFIQFVRLTLLHTTQVVAQPKVTGKCSRFAKTVAAAEAQ